MPEPLDEQGGDSKNWLDVAIEESNKDPQIIEFKKMLGEIKQVVDPLKVISDTEVPEFQYGSAKNGLVKTIDQGQMVSSEGLPLRSDNASNCQFVLLRTPLPQEKTRYTLVHLLSGFFELNHSGNRLQDLLKLTNSETTALFVTGSRNNNIVVPARDLKIKGGITTLKHINVNSDSQGGWISLVYKPQTNEALVKVGDIEDTHDVLVFEGF